MLKLAESFTLKEWNERLKEKYGEKLFCNGDYYTFLIHLSQKKEYSVAELIKKPDTFLEGIMAEVMKEPELAEFGGYGFTLSFAGEAAEDLRPFHVFEVTNIRFERSMR